MILIAVESVIDGVDPHGVDGDDFAVPDCGHGGFFVIRQCDRQNGGIAVGAVNREQCRFKGGILEDFRQIDFDPPHLTRRCEIEIEHYIMIGCFHTEKFPDKHPAAFRHRDLIAGAGPVTVRNGFSVFNNADLFGKRNDIVPILLKPGSSQIRCEFRRFPKELNPRIKAVRQIVQHRYDHI